MKVAMMQPTFMPWQGYFELIYRSEIFIFLDDFQFSVQSYHQRNRLFTDRDRVDWYMVPIQKTVSFKSPLNKTKIHETGPWRKKMWMRLKTNYERCEYFDSLRDDLQDWLLTPASSLSAFNIRFILLMCKHLNISREIRYSSEYPLDLKRSERVLELLHWCNADQYYCVQGAFSYMFKDGIFPIPNIKVVFQDYCQHPYPQKGSPQNFTSYLSILDAMLNIGPEKTMKLIQNGTQKWITWDEMIGTTDKTPYTMS